jgi:hypothetical protein
MAEAFLEKPTYASQVIHKDENVYNNDLENLLY